MQPSVQPTPRATVKDSCTADQDRARRAGEHLVRYAYLGVTDDPVAYVFYGTANMVRLQNTISAWKMGGVSREDLEANMRTEYRNNLIGLFGSALNDPAVLAHVALLNAGTLERIRPILEQARRAQLQYAYDKAYGYGDRLPDHGVVTRGGRRELEFLQEQMIQDRRQMYFPPVEEVMRNQEGPPPAPATGGDVVRAKAASAQSLASIFKANALG